MLSVTAKFEVNAPRLWYPLGYGAQPLYRLRVEFEGEDGSLSNVVTQTIGFRLVELDTAAVSADPQGASAAGKREEARGGKGERDGEPPDQGGDYFRFWINRVPVFVKGSNFIPADSFESRLSDSQLVSLLRSAADVNLNMIRNWGGGIYQRDVFYQTCNELGLMVGMCVCVCVCVCVYVCVYVCVCTRAN
jgi:beta-mannosidase